MSAHNLIRVEFLKEVPRGIDEAPEVIPFYVQAGMIVSLNPNKRNPALTEAFITNVGPAVVNEEMESIAKRVNEALAVSNNAPESAAWIAPN